MRAKVPPGVEDWGDQLASRTMEIASTGMTAGVRATREPARHRSSDEMDAAGAHGDAGLTRRLAIRRPFGCPPLEITHVVLPPCS